ncbi:hypothetical protein CEXT_705371 [Caerostris extrusa]|uniref:Uncharacterized protein n=1 Tax=Caerostris extrusa TaxID=172846 RepID=A0AAV4W9W4_CAEEX|nr:hypothetical protein CEXT_705371 [Caerostris extrusa]
MDVCSGSESTLNRRDDKTAREPLDGLRLIMGCNARELSLDGQSTRPSRCSTLTQNVHPQQKPALSSQKAVVLISGGGSNGGMKTEGGGPHDGCVAGLNGWSLNTASRWSADTRVGVPWWITLWSSKHSKPSCQIRILTNHAKEAESEACVSTVEISSVGLKIFMFGVGREAEHPNAASE